MGKLIKVLSASLITRPKAAITLSAVGLGGVAFIGLCAPNSATIPVLLPLTALARRLGAPNLSNVATNLIMYPAILPSGHRCLRGVQHRGSAGCRRLSPPHWPPPAR
jgi:hypothetical protein